MPTARKPIVLNLPGIEVTTALADALGKEWPLTIDKGTIHSARGGKLLFAVTDQQGTTLYGLNGLAVTGGAADIRPIWKDDPDVPGLKLELWLTEYAYGTFQALACSGIG
jgi:hypothetical protein